MPNTLNAHWNKNSLLIAGKGLYIACVDEPSLPDVCGVI